MTAFNARLRQENGAAAVVWFLWMLCALPTRADNAASPAEAIRQKAQEVGQALVKQDYATVVNLTYPGIVQLLGGREKMLQVVRDRDKKLRAQGYVIQSAKVGDPGTVVKGGSESFCILPVTLQASVPKGKITAKSFLLAISSDDGKSWTFIDGSSLTPESVKQVAPQFPDALKLPEQQKATFEKAP